MPQKSNVRYWLIIWIFVLSAVAYLDRTNISIAGRSIMADFGLDKVHFGWQATAFLLGYAGFQVPAGYLVTRYGPRLILALGLVWWGVLSFATTIVPTDSLTTLMIVRFVLGMGEAVMYPCANQFIANWFPANERGMANGWVFGGVGAGAGLTPPLLTWIMLTYGWHEIFWFSSVVGLVAAAVWYLAARDKPSQHPNVSPAELAHIKAGIPVTVAGEKPPVPWGRIFASKDVWLVLTAYFAYGYVAFIFLTWFFIYLSDGRGVDLRKSAVYTMMPFIAMTVCCLVGGWWSDRLSRAKGPYIGRCVFAAVSLIATAVFLVVGAHAADPLVASITLAGGAGALYLGQSSYWAIAANYAGPHTGIVSGMINMGAQIAGAITATLTPWIAQNYGWEIAFYVAAALALVCGMAWFLVNPGNRLHEEREEVSA